MKMNHLQVNLMKMNHLQVNPESESPEASTLKIGELKGVGKATEEKLRAAGFDTIESLVSVDAEAISEKTGISSKVTAKLIESAKELLE